MSRNICINSDPVPDIVENTRDSASRTKLLETGLSLFNKFGVRKVTVEEICREACVSKMTFYRFFNNKTDLLRSVIMDLTGRIMQEYRELMDRDIPFEEKITETISLKSRTAAMLSEEILKDIYSDPSGEVMGMLTKMADEAMATVLGDYRKAQEKGQLRKDLNISFIPYYTNRVIEMMNDPELLKLYGGNRHEVIRELTGLFFYGILPPGTKK